MSTKTITEVGDEWRCYIDGERIVVDGIDWQPRDAEGHGLVLDVNETQWLQSCVGIGRYLLARRAAR